MKDIRERLKEANKVEEMRKKADKERIAELEQENARLREELLLIKSSCKDAQNFVN